MTDKNDTEETEGEIIESEDDNDEFMLTLDDEENDGDRPD